MPADVYSFAVTVLEIITWKDAFPSNEFKFPWNIADSICEGKRPRAIDDVEIHGMKQLIEMMWCQNPRDRITIKEVIEKLEDELMRLNVISFFK